MKARHICNGIFLLGCLISSLAVASATVNVANPSFEIPAGPLPNTCTGTNCTYSTTAPSGWMLAGGGGEFNPGNPANTIYFNSIPDGVKVGYTSPGGILTQNVGMVTQAGAAYTLTVQLGWRKDQATFDGNAILIIGGGPPIFATGTPPTQGNFSTFTATYLSTPADIGSQIIVELNSTTFQGDFDEVNVTEVNDAFQVQYIANVQSGGIINITNTGSSSTGPKLGKLCVNIYVFDPSEEILECCSCPVTPNGLVTVPPMGLVSNNLTREVPTSIVVKLVATQDDGPTATCDASTAGSSTAPLAAGMRAWSTTLHVPPTPPVIITPAAASTNLSTTEDEFLNGGLSAAELSHITSFCHFIEIDGSTHGICPACEPGGLAGAKQ